MPVVLESKPDDHFVLSLLACLFCNWICGLVALIYSSQVRESIILFGMQSLLCFHVKQDSIVAIER